MSRIFAIGETLLDIIFRNGLPVSATPGGSMLNTAVSLGRLGLEIYFVSDYGHDEVGGMIDDFLAANGVNTRFIQHYEHHKSGLALAFLNEANDASYRFYKDFPENRMTGINIPFTEDDFLLFGSFFSITSGVREALLRILDSARKAGSTIMYDPNFRKPHLHELEIVKPMIIENIRHADIVRGSDEDFELIFGASTPEEAWKVVKEAGCSVLIYTANKNGVDILTGDHTLHLGVAPVETVSTIGAGDNFNAGILSTLARSGHTRRDIPHLSEDTWREAGENGIAFAADVCMHYENYLSPAFAAKFLKDNKIKR